VAVVNCYYYVTESGRSPVREFVYSLDLNAKRKLFFVKALLEEFGHRLHYPHAKYMGNSIFELRFKGGEGAIRILYFFFERDKAIFTNGFIKKSDRTPKKEITTAIERREKFLAGQGGDDI